MATFYNQATLSYGGGVLNSNTTEAELLSGLELTKTVVSSSYESDGSIIYAITLSNLGSASYTGLTVSDDLGAYPLAGGGYAVPLDYVEGSILYYLNGVLQPAPTVVATGALQISGIDLPSESTATFIYETNVNEFAPVSEGSSITNTATVNELTASATVSVRENAELTIAKAVCPPILSDNDTLTYTIIVQNLGNTPVLATDGAIISDVFNPPLSDITVALNGETLTEGVNYTYNPTSGEFSTTNGTVSVPAATYVQNPETGVIVTTPGTAVLTVTGTV